MSDMIPIQYLIWALPLILAPLLYIWKDMLQRIYDLERKVQSLLTKEDVNTIISDKLDPVKEDLSEIKTRLSKIIDKLLGQ